MTRVRISAMGIWWNDRRGSTHLFRWRTAWAWAVIAAYCAGILAATVCGVLALDGGMDMLRGAR